MAESSPSAPPLSQPILWEGRDLFLALGIALFGLAIYTRVLAPDVLYGDSGEFQTLAYTWSTTHTTGYPVYLVFARIIGLIPVGTLAWRVNFASAVAAAFTLGGVYLIARSFTRSIGAVLASAVLLISYTFWSQSVMTEVYTTATAFIVAVLLALLISRARPAKRGWMLFLAGFLLTVGLGVHLFLMLIAPAVFLFVLWGVLVGPPDERGRWKHLLLLIAGAAAGLLTFYLLFIYMDMRPTPTNMLTTSIVPSRDVWNLTESDLDSEPERFWISVSGLQWRDRMIPDDVDYQNTILSFLYIDLAREFATPTLLLALFGGLAALFWQRRLCALTGVGLAVTFTAGLVYFPGDKYLFYLPFYVLLSILAGVGAGYLVGWVTRIVPAPVPRAIPSVIVTVILIAVCAAPFINTRWKSIQVGRSGFVKEDYAYPVNKADEPRRAAECALSKVPESDALLVLDWRALYSIYYVAHVEQGRTGIIIHEALPYPARAVAKTLQDEIAARLANGETVYVDNDYNPLRNTFTLTRVPGACSNYNLFKLALKT
jgi:transmembrane protein TMEM260 (protein O-mannosyltransferase)